MKKGVGIAVFLLIVSLVGFCSEALVWFLGYREAAFTKRPITIEANAVEFHLYSALNLSIASALAVAALWAFLGRPRNEDRENLSTSGKDE